MAYCKLPWQSVMITPLGDFRLCALTSNLTMDEGMVRDADGKLMNIMTHDLKDGLNGEWHRAIRLHDIKTEGKEWHELCSCCKDREVATGGDPKNINSSRRQSLVKRNVTDNFNKVDQVDENGYVNWTPTSLDIRFGNLCNQKCIQCGPNYSNQWYEDWVGFYDGNLTVPWGFGHRTITLERDKHGKLFNPKEVKWWESPIWWKKFEEILPTLEHIYITGGEPMIVPAHDEMLDRIIESGRARQIYLEYDSNLSVINNKLAERWNHFKHVEIAGSIDASGDHYGFIRSGNWENFKNNVTKLKEYYKNDGIVKLHRLTSCVQISTTHSIMETEDWVRSQGIPFQIRFVDSPKMHAIMSLPCSAKEELAEMYSTRKTQVGQAIYNYLLEHLDEKYESAWAVHRYVKLMNHLDKVRGTNWRTTISGTADLLDRHMK